MKTIRQIAEEIGVTKQAVYKRYKGKLYKSVLPYARRANGATYILEQGESIIKQDLLKDSAYTGAHTEYAPEMLVLVIQKELAEISRQVAELTAVIKSQQKPRPQKVKRQINRPLKSAPIESLLNK